MKKLILIITILIMTFANNLNGEIYGKQNYGAVNPFGLLFKIYSGEYGRFLDMDGTYEVNIPFYLTIWEDINAYGFGGKFRMYKDKNGEGVFYGGGLEVDMVTWDNIAYWNGEQWRKETTNWVMFTPLAEAGYRWTWENGWTIAPSVELGYSMSSYEDEHGYWGDPDYGDAGVHWSLNLGVAYMFNF